MVFTIANNEGRVLVFAPREGQLDARVEQDATVEVAGTVAHIVPNLAEELDVDEEYRGELASSRTR